MTSATKVTVRDDTGSAARQKTPEPPAAMKAVLVVDCLIYRGLLRYRGRHAAASPDRDEPIATRMKRAQ
jgi:hypothetical protein